jgi:CheY-like chemotaxis protein
MTTVLLLDDNPDMLKVLSQVLEWGGYQVATGRNGHEGIQYLQEANPLPEVIISDLTMPHMDGAQLLHTVRGNPEWAHIPFVMMSAQSMLDNQSNEAVDAVLTKPFNLEDFQLILHQWTTSDH